MPYKRNGLIESDNETFLLEMHSKNVSSTQMFSWEHLWQHLCKLDYYCSSFTLLRLVYTEKQTFILNNSRFAWLVAEM